MANKRLILLLGSNLGDSETNIYRALQRLEDSLGPPIAITKILKNKAVEFESNNIFCNIAAVYSTSFSPIKILEIAKNIEMEMGRKTDSSVGGYKDRIIDIDLVGLDGVRFYSDRLVLPHKKHLEERDFSGVLLNELITLLQEITTV